MCVLYHRLARVDRIAPVINNSLVLVLVGGWWWCELEAGVERSFAEMKSTSLFFQKQTRSPSPRAGPLAMPCHVKVR